MVRNGHDHECQAQRAKDSGYLHHSNQGAGAAHHKHHTQACPHSHRNSWLDIGVYRSLTSYRQQVLVRLHLEQVTLQS